MAEMDDGALQDVERIYSDPVKAVGRYGAKAHMDLILVELAILEEMRETRRLLEVVLHERGKGR
jgi:hypothetical protein